MYGIFSLNVHLCKERLIRHFVDVGGVGCLEEEEVGGGLRVEDWGMKADFLLAALATCCISCPTTAERDGWLS